MSISLENLNFDVFLFFVSSSHKEMSKINVIRTIVLATDISEIVGTTNAGIGTARVLGRVDIEREIVAQDGIPICSLPRKFPVKIADLPIGHPSFPSFPSHRKDNLIIHSFPIIQ